MNRTRIRVGVLLAVLAAVVFALTGCAKTTHTTRTTTATVTSTTTTVPAPPAPNPSAASMCQSYTTDWSLQCKHSALLSSTSSPLVGGRLGGFVPINGTDTYGGAANVANFTPPHFDISYLCGCGGKDWNRGDLDYWHSKGKPTGFVWEQGAAQAEDGCGQGTLDAERALAEANALGAPPYSVIHAAVDTDASGASVKNYFICWAHVLGPLRAGDYGSYFVVRDLNEWGIITSRATWETRAWSQGMLYHGACLYQSAIPPMENTNIDGTGVDQDLQLCPDAGLYPFAQAPPVNPHHYNWLPDTRRAFRVLGNSTHPCKKGVKGCHVIHTRERQAAERFDNTGCVLDKTTHHFKRLTCKVVAQHLRLLAGRIWDIAHKTKNLKHKASKARWGDPHFKSKGHVTTLGMGYQEMVRRSHATQPVTAF